MSVPPNVFPNSSNFAYNVVVGGHKNDPPSDESGTLKVIDPLRHSESGYSHENMPFVTMLRSPTQSALEETPFPPEPGTVVAVSWTTGDPTTRAVVGQPNELNNSASIPGNDGVMGHVTRAMGYEVGKRKPIEKTEEKQDRGAIVREKKERSGEWSHNLTRGLATHAAWYPMAGQVLEQVKNIDTAIQSFASIPSLSALSGMSGGALDISGILGKMTPSQKKRATSHMDPVVLGGLESMLGLISQTSPGGTYVSVRVDEPTLLESAVQLLGQAHTLSEVMTVLGLLRSDSSLWGQDKLEPLVFTANNSLGIMSQTRIGASGSSSSSADILGALKSFLGLLGSNQGGAQGKFLFGEAGELMTKAFDRIPPNIRKDLVQKTAQLTESLQHNEVHRRTLGTADPRPLALF